MKITESLTGDVIKCSNCGLPKNRATLCDRWDCPSLKSPCCQIFGAPVPDDMVGVRINAEPVMISRRLATKILTTLEDISPGGQYCGNGFLGYRFKRK